MSKKNILIALLSIALIIALVWPSSPPGDELVINSEYEPVEIFNPDEITCEYPRVMMSGYTSGELKYSLPSPEENPMIITFSDLQSNTPKLKALDATRTISETPLVKLDDFEERIMLIEGSGEPYLTVYTIYKDTGISTFTKQASLFSEAQYTTMSVGTCR